MPCRAGLRWPSISILKSISALQMPRRSAMSCSLVTSRTRLPVMTGWPKRILSIP